jgi:PHD/YefM family antitoxin component YafN of YafNO toxin-antitoxin module
VKRNTPKIVLNDGKPSAVILDIEEYREILERPEDFENLKMLKEVREKSLNLKSWKTS